MGLARVQISFLVGVAVDIDTGADCGVNLRSSAITRAFFSEPFLAGSGSNGVVSLSNSVAVVAEVASEVLADVGVAVLAKIACGKQPTLRAVIQMPNRR